MTYLQKNTPTESELIERFLSYAKTHSTSNSKKADAGIIPSTDCQIDFAYEIASELKSLGFSDAGVYEYGYVYAYIPASGGKEGVQPFCLLAHLDTVEDVSGKDVKPQVVKNYDGKTINLQNGFTLDPTQIAELALAAANKETIITTDGTTLLGGDDKAGLCAIVTALHYLLEHPEIPHGKIEIMFSPDEETGHGMDKVPLDLLSSKYAYTVDGGHIGELESECFNAYKSTVTFTGKASHTGTARKNKMVNAISACSQFVASLPRDQSPETTDGMQGFFAPLEISGNMENASVSLLLRDFEMQNMERRKTLVEQLAASTAAAFNAAVKVEHVQQYLNMREGIAKMPFVKEQLIAAYKASGVEPNFQAIRGGTDGSRLTEMGIPCPNIFTGAHNYHSQLEWVSVDQMLCAADVIINLATLAAK